MRLIGIGSASGKMEAIERYFRGNITNSSIHCSVVVIEVVNCYIIVSTVEVVVPERDRCQSPTRRLPTYYGQLSPNLT